MYKHSDRVVTFIPPQDIEEAAMKQIENTASLPFLFKHVAVMPDTHYGMGATVGTVLATKGAVCPAAVGVDIGCGMIAVRTNLKRNDIKDLAALRASIERSVPMSAGKFKQKITESAQKRIDELVALAGDVDMDKKFGTNNWKYQLGTLGGGNHFIEICVDTEDTIWVTLHSGSRGIGNKIGLHYIKIAQETCDKYLVQLPDRDLAYLVEGTDDFNDYLRDLHWAQRFALLNREEMMDMVLKDISYALYNENGHQIEFEVERINCHHNFTQIENHFGSNVWVTRKGAIEASEGKMAMIPGSMGTRSYIVCGKGCAMSFNSAPHGAGRRFSRTEARKRYTMDDFDKAMVGIEHRRNDVLLDELPAAYKDIDEVMENAKELVEIKYTLKQILNCKGD